MGCWGVKALESDNCLDLLYFMENTYDKNTEIPLHKLIKTLLKEGFIISDETNGDYFYDNIIICLCELVLDEKLCCKIKGDKTSIHFLQKHIRAIQNTLDANNEVREYVYLWQESEYRAEWEKHIETINNNLKHLSIK